MNIGFRENMTVEFKSDLKKLSDDVIIESVVAFANTDGGKFFLGVEDNGDITGLHPSHNRLPAKLGSPGHNIAWHFPYPLPCGNCLPS